jgi:hypothetical protein
MAPDLREPTAGAFPVNDLCLCGVRSMTPEQRLGCVQCGQECCVACAFSVDAFTYCGRCGERLLEAGGGPLELRWWEPTRHLVTSHAGRPWIIIVARDQPDLFEHLIRAFSRDEKVEVVLDRRRGLSRNPPEMADRLRTQGAAVVRRP